MGGIGPVPGGKVYQTELGKAESFFFEGQFSPSTSVMASCVENGCEPYRQVILVPRFWMRIIKGGLFKIIKIFLNKQKLLFSKSAQNISFYFPQVQTNNFKIINIQITQ